MSWCEREAYNGFAVAVAVRQVPYFAAEAGPSVRPSVSILHGLWLRDEEEEAAMPMRGGLKTRSPPPPRRWYGAHHHLLPQVRTRECDYDLCTVWHWRQAGNFLRWVNL